jgi:hypothetical protein
LAKRHLLPPSPLRIRQRTEGEGRTVQEAGRWGCSPAAPATGTAGDEGKRERRARGTYSRAHLELLRTVEAALRGGSGAAAVLGGGGAVELVGRGRDCCASAVSRCVGPGSRRPPFIGGGGGFGKGRYFLRRDQLRRARAASRGLGRVNLCRDSAGD